MVMFATMRVLQNSNLVRADNWLAERRSKTLLILIFLSALFRLIFSLQISDSPFLWKHHWKSADMYFFDQWGADLANGNWLTDKALHPLPNWQREISQDALKTHPELLASVQQDAAASGDSDLDRVLWNRWDGGKCYHQEPLYPYLVGLTYKMLWRDIRWVLAWQALLGLCGIALVFEITFHYFGALAGTLGGVLTLLYAPLLYHEFLLLRDSTIVFFMLLLIYLIIKFERQQNLNWMAAFGLAAGLAWLSKSTFTIFILGSLVGWGLYVKERRKFLRGSAFMLGALLLALLPFIARNLYVGVAPFKFASPGGAALTVLIWNSNLYESSLHMHAEHSGALLADTGTSFSAAAWAAFKSHPSVFSFLKMTAVKFCAIWHWFEIPDNTNFYYGRLEAPVLVWLPITFWVLASLGLAGLLLYLKSWRTLWPLYLAVCWSILPLWLVTPNSRYRQTLTVALIPFAAILLVRCCDWLLEKKYWNACKLGLVVLPLACWMLRPLPPNILIIRVADYVVPYQTFYRPRIEAAMQSKNWQRMEELVLDALHYEPEAIKNCDRAHPALSDIEAGLAEVFAWTHFAYYMCLNNLGRNEQATQEFERANELRFIINNRNPKP